MSGPCTTVIVHACLRDGNGGSPTAVVLDDDRLTDEERRRVPLEHGTSHAVFLRRRPEREPTVDQPAVHIRFFTSSGELPACGHGTVAALAFLASRTEDAGGYRALLRTSTRTFEGRALREGAYLTAAFDPGPVDLRQASAEERSLVLPALGLAAADAAQDVRVAGVGRERLLIPVDDRAALATLDPNSGKLREVCDHLGFLGAYVYSPPSPAGALAARMFAPSIGVPEDIANANSTACLAAHLAGRGINRIAVDMGDAVGSPATITASTHPTPSGPRVQVGGTATIGPPLPRA
ncbi:PhzF family phenazine biosynthesis isomerase [Streptomyces sp. NPDC089915]|uniref:PhzF family phenazine biosynthesis protein n=1 Tax=Streptomyces sp. NPDC089915 TaxID=3155186 RepID=UPI003435CB7E